MRRSFQLRLEEELLEDIVMVVVRDERSWRALEEGDVGGLLLGRELRLLLRLERLEVVRGWVGGDDVVGEVGEVGVEVDVDVEAELP